MNNYEIEFRENCFFISNLFLFMSFVNGGLWSYDCFFNTMFAEIEDYSSKLYGLDKWQMINHVLDPIVIFYRFNCFMFLLDKSSLLNGNNNVLNQRINGREAGGSSAETVSLTI